MCQSIHVKKEIVSNFAKIISEMIEDMASPSLKLGNFRYNQADII